MLTGKELGAAIDRAIQLKKVPKTAVAAHFGIRGPSIYDWIKHGRIGKQHLDELVAYFSDVVGPEHWGIRAPNAYKNASQPAGLDLETLQIALVAVKKAIRKANVDIDLYDTAPLIALAYRERSSLPAKPTAEQLKKFDQDIIDRLRLGVTNGEWGEGRVAGTGSQSNKASQAKKSSIGSG